MKQALVYLRDYKAGTLTEDENGYTFLYDRDFLQSAHAEAISLTMPLTDKSYKQ
ncbi:HipA N-terminal domain-containing protein [Bacteroides oleiciplenus]|uniref:HipA domain-containing protein n=1 Tax=Bacteroides oleiciplenus YIT 12058 TaxID=742727 RepID=K9EP68_9BACE|nr:HipA N-terminal domain-containing protein [Bacteroides oleiciplenus]EKU90960.1 HipA domain-containing protein [Bacteroides oleiciplenus YIT 12058]